jgi:Right handed beta helix region
MRSRTMAAAALAAGLLLLPAAAAAQAPSPSYPEPSDPGAVTPAPKGKGKTRTVCKRGCRYSRIQAAVNRSRPGDTVRVRNGTYREAVRIRGARKSYVALIGNPKAPGKVVLQGSKSRQNGVLVDGADEVTVRGFKAKGYAANGFFFVNVVGYTARDLIAARTGVYGVYAFNSKGGTMRDSEAYYTSDAGFYIGQTPPQARPIRSIVRNVDSWGNPIGFSGTNMRYVTITGSRFYNNASGIVPNGLDSEKFPPAEDNVIRGNEIFWNNFDFHKGAPFDIRTSGVAAITPVGSGVVLLGGRRTLVEGNQIFGNYAAGVAMVEDLLLQKNLQARALVGNVVRDNAFGLGGADLNGRELAYDGNGTDNCFSGNTGVSVTIPADGSTFAGCPHVGPNAFSAAIQQQLYAQAGEAAVPLWIKHPHAPRSGIEPLELYTP